MENSHEERLDDLEKAVDRVGFRIKILYVLIILNIGTAVLLRFV